MYRINEADLSILASIELEAQKSIASIAKETGLQSHSVNYRLAKLRDLKIVGPLRAAIDPYRLGFFDLHLVFAVSSATAAERKKFLSWTEKESLVVWLAAIGGQFQYGMSLRAKELRAALLFVDRFREIFPNFVHTQQLSIITAINSYGRRYLYPNRKSYKHFSNRLSKDVISNRDATDFQILSGLSSLEFSSERELSGQLGIPATTVRRRVTELEQNKVITGYYHHIDAAKLGYQAYKLLIFSKSLNAKLLDQLQAFAHSHKNVVHLLEALGSWQAEFVVEVKEASQASQIASQIQDQLGLAVDAIHVIPIFQVLKSVQFSSVIG